MQFDIHEPVFGDDGEYLEKKAIRYREQLLALFEQSPEGQPFFQERGGPYWADLTVDLGIGYLGVTPSGMSAQHLREILFSLFPRKVSAEPEEAAEVIEELHAFWTFLQREFGLQNAAACLKVLDGKAVRKLERELGDPSNFGMAKSFVALGQELGFEMDTEEGIQEWVNAYNAAMRAAYDRPVPPPDSKDAGAQEAGQKPRPQGQTPSRRQKRQRKKKR